MIWLALGNCLAYTFPSYERTIGNLFVILTLIDIASVFAWIFFDAHDGFHDAILRIYGWFTAGNGLRALRAERDALVQKMRTRIAAMATIPYRANLIDSLPAAKRHGIDHIPPDLEGDLARLETVEGILAHQDTVEKLLARSD